MQGRAGFWGRPATSSGRVTNLSTLIGPRVNFSGSASTCVRGHRGRSLRRSARKRSSKCRSALKYRPSGSAGTADTTSAATTSSTVASSRSVTACPFEPGPLGPSLSGQLSYTVDLTLPKENTWHTADRHVRLNDLSVEAGQLHVSPGVPGRSRTGVVLIGVGHTAISFVARVGRYLEDARSG